MTKPNPMRIDHPLSPLYEDQKAAERRVAADLRREEARFRARRRPHRDDGCEPAVVEPPRPNKPLAGGAEAALEFDPKADHADR
jgi:hypothetical protein